MEYLLCLTWYFGIFGKLNGVLNPSIVPEYWEAWVVILREFLLCALFD